MGDESRRSEVTLRQIYDNANVGFVLGGPQGNILSSNHAFSEMLGFTREELGGKNFSDLTHPDDLPQEVAFFTEIIQGRRDAYRVEKRYIHKDGREIWVRLNVNTLRDSGGNIEKFIAVVENIQDIKEKENAYKELSRKYLMQVERMPLGYLEMDRSFTIASWNPAAERMFGYGPQEVLGKNVFELLSPGDEEEHLEDLKRKLITSSGGEHSINRNRRKDGHILICEWVNTPLFDIQGEIIGWVSLCTDITRRVETEQQLRIQAHQLSRAKEAAEAANRAKSTFLANMSHEIRTPLHAVIGYSDLMAPHIHEPRPKEYLQSIRNASETLLALINDVLDLSKIEAEKLEIHPSSQEPHKLLKEIESLFSLKAREKDLAFALIIPENLPVLLLYDDLRVRQILINLLGNAIKFTDKGRVTLETRVYPQKSGRWDLKFLVVDTGIGIPAQFQGEIFNPFRQWNTQVTRKYGGTGLGLSIAKRLAVMMGGTISFSSLEGQGTTFEFSLPGLEVPPEPIPQGLTAPEAEQIRLQGRILLVDDVPMNRKLLRHYLESTGLTIEEAQDGQEALERMEIHKPDLVLMDIRMPRMDGMEALRIIRTRPDWEGIKIIALTASVSQGRESLLINGFDEVMTKPAKQGEILGALSRFLRLES